MAEEKKKEEKEKKVWDTEWYDDLCKMYQRTKIPELRNVLWEQVKLLVFSRVRKFITDRRGTALRRNPELCQKINQESFFIFLKACDRWDPARGTKFLTFLGDILDQEIMNIVRLDWYYKTRDVKIGNKLLIEKATESRTQEQEEFEKAELLEEIRRLLDEYTFDSELEQDIVWTMIYGVSGDWTRLQRKHKLSIATFTKARKKVIEKLKKYFLDHCDEKQKCVLKEMLETR